MPSLEGNIRPRFKDECLCIHEKNSKYSLNCKWSFHLLMTRIKSSPCKHIHAAPASDHLNRSSLWCRSSSNTTTTTTTSLCDPWPQTPALWLNLRLPWSSLTRPCVSLAAPPMSSVKCEQLNNVPCGHSEERTSCLSETNCGCVFLFSFFLSFFFFLFSLNFF